MHFTNAARKDHFQRLIECVHKATIFFFAGAVPRFAPSDWASFTYNFVTIVGCVCLATSSLFAISVAIGFRCLLFATEATWKVAFAHGILMIWVNRSCILLASLGFLPRGEFKALMADAKPALGTNSKDCICVHRFDLAVGHQHILLLLFFGIFSLSDKSIVALPLKIGIGFARTIIIVDNI